MALARLYQSVYQAGRKHVPLARDISTTNRNFFIKHSPNATLDHAIQRRFRKSLKRKDKVSQATYLWIDGTGENLRSKDRILEKPPVSAKNLPIWTYDGSSTYQTSDGDLYLVPKAIYKDPFSFSSGNVLIMCETLLPDGTPTPTNHRRKMEEAVDLTKDLEPYFGIEQEYTLIGPDGRPFGWPKNGFPASQGPYYCGVGANVAFGRVIVESHLLACLFAGVGIFGTNAEVLPSQWEFQTQPGEGMKAADDLWVARYILKRVAEYFGVDVSFDPKPVEGNWNGSGAHTNFSTKCMREKANGLNAIKDAICKLEKRHAEHIAVYDPHGGKDNLRRLIGALETSSIDKFSWGVGSRKVSVRIPQSVADMGMGYLEDRRPASNCDPYAVCNALIRTCLLDE